ncbi:MAG: RraA family protein [Candidatus Tectomicrobia bacterium]|nr:RraA family protein [Candidatus Tectomicrobia bacterium]
MNARAEFFSNVATATLADAATALGLNLIMEGPRPVVPETYPRFAGPAYTMVFAPVRDPGKKPPYGFYDVVDAIPPGAVMVVDAAGSPLAAWGGGSSGVCARRGAAGCVIDGATRDLEDIRRLGFPVFSRSVWSLAFPRRLEVVAKGTPVTCCGVRVEPGDIVAADIDGVAVVPLSRFDDVKRQIERIQAIEKEVKGRAAKGEAMSDLFPLLAKKFTTD